MEVAIDLVRDALVVSMKLSLPLLAVGMVVGILISILQTATQLQEQTLTFVPKILAVVAATFVGLPWLLTVIMDYTRSLFIRMAFLLD